MRVLLIEDDSTIGRTIQLGLREAGMQCEWQTSGR